MFKKLSFVAILVSLIATAFSMPAPKFQDGNCPSSPARLKQADIAVVTVGDGETLNLRVSPNLNAERIVKIPAYTYVTIIAGPICDGGYRWFEVGWDGKDGWSAEVGPDGEYNMIPNGDPVPDNNDSIPWSPPHDCENCTMPAPGGLTEDFSNTCNYDPGYCPSGKCSPQLYQHTPSDNLQIYIVVDCQLRRIPTDSTLRALGIEEIYDMPQASDLNMPFGEDIPYADGQEAEFCAFKNEYFRSVEPVDGALDCSNITPPQIIEPQKQVIPIWYGADIYIFIYDGKDARIRKVPNPDTLDALSITRDQVQEFPSWAGIDVVDGGDIPDVNIDPVGFCEFKHTNFPQVPDPPEGPCNITPPPLVEVPIESQEEEPSWWCANVGWFCNIVPEVAASTNTTCYPQCVEKVRLIRKDMTTKSLWANASTSDGILKIALNMPKFQYLGQEMQVRVRDASEAPESGDVVIWPSGCGNVWSPTDADGNKLPGGHIGQVLSSSGITINVHDANWDNNCGIRDDIQIQILPCMRFVTEPFPAGTYVPTVQPAVINCDIYQGWQNFACNYIPWWKP